MGTRCSDAQGIQYANVAHCFSDVSHLLLFSRVETASEWHEDVIDILDAGDVDIYKAHRILVEWA